MKPAWIRNVRIETCTKRIVESITSFKGTLFSLFVINATKSRLTISVEGEKMHQLSMLGETRAWKVFTL